MRKERQDEVRGHLAGRWSGCGEGGSTVVVPHMSNSSIVVVVPLGNRYDFSRVNGLLGHTLVVAGLPAQKFLKLMILLGLSHKGNQILVHIGNGKEQPTVCG